MIFWLVALSYPRYPPRIFTTPNKSWLVFIFSRHLPIKSVLRSLAGQPSPMAQIANKDLNANARRRLASVAHHLTPLHSTTPNCSSLGFHTTSAPDSYRRVHGEVPTHDVTWNPACDESGKAFTDIIYEKAVGEAIAKVCFHLFAFKTIKQMLRRLLIVLCFYCFRLRLTGQREEMPSDPIR